MKNIDVKRLKISNNGELIVFANVDGKTVKMENLELAELVGERKEFSLKECKKNRKDKKWD